ncbi:MAG TPA: hypothetical protein VE870_06665 [Bacteroidales bacterium]|nr:hypothetical protein [Bacteroidales bacterium]
MKEEFFIILAIEKIVQKTGWGPLDTWTNYNYSMLNEEIRKVTGKRISESTLKRMFGKKKAPSDFYNPHAYTRNILAEYLGYSNWEEFKRENRLNLKADDANGEANQEGDGHGKRRAWLIAASVTFVFFVGFLFLRDVIMPKNQRNPLKSFLCENPVGKLPYTALFNYDLIPVKDSVIVDFGNSEEYFLSPDRKLITEFYRAGDYAHVTVKMHNKLLAHTFVHILTDGWQGGVSPNDTSTAFVPFNDQGIIREKGRLYVTPEELGGLGYKRNGDYYVEYRYFDEFKTNIDQVSLETIAKNNPEEGGKLCYDIEIIMKGENHDFVLRFLEPGCFRYVRFYVGEKKFYGRFDDLSEFARDVSDWRDIRIDISGMVAKIYFQGELIHTESYTEPMGNLKGIIYRFYGNGSVDYVNLKSGGQNVIRDDFGARLSPETPVETQ